MQALSLPTLEHWKNWKNNLKKKQQQKTVEHSAMC